MVEPGPPDDPAVVHDTVAIVGLDGLARAKANWSARKRPAIGAAAAFLQPEARVAAGRVYYADAGGTIRALTPAGKVSTVTTFPLTSVQQELSFAVSPDGARLAASVFAFPPVHVPPPQTPADPPFNPGPYRLDLLVAESGGQAAALRHLEWPQPGPPQNALSMVTWDVRGPVATVDTALASQQGSQGRQWFGHLGRVDARGQVGPALGGADCQAWAELYDGTVLCSDDAYARASLRTADGVVLFTLPAAAKGYTYLTVAPDGQHLAYLSSGSAVVVGLDGSSISLRSGFSPMGWLDRETIIGALPSGQGKRDLAYIKLSVPSHVEDLGFSGVFIGVVQGSP